MKRQVEAKKAEKLKKSLHLIDFPKMNTQIKFVSNYDQIRSQLSKPNDSDDDDRASASMAAQRT